MKIKGKSGSGIDPAIRLAMEIGRVDRRFATNPMLAVMVASKVFLVLSLMQRLNVFGRQAWEDFRRVAETITTDRDRLQFLSQNPNDFHEIKILAELSEHLYTQLGISKKNFLIFYGFANLTGTFYLADKLEEVKMSAQNIKGVRGREGKDSAFRAKAYRKIIKELEAKIAAPTIRMQAELANNIAVLKRLLVANTSLQVLLSFDHPHYIWLSHQPMPPKREVNNSDYGKWVVNTTDVTESVVIVRKLWPFFTSGDLGQAKFDLRPRVPGVLAVIVYSQEMDEEVYNILMIAAGKKPFWVPDEYCYEAEALGQVMQALSARVVNRRIFSEDLLLKLANDEFCQSRGLSKIQAELIKRIFHPEADHETAYAHVAEGYFSGHEAEVADLNLGGEGLQAFYTHVIPAVLDDENLDFVRQTLFARRKAFHDAYSGRRG